MAAGNVDFTEREEQTMNLAYEKCGDYLIPNLIPDPKPEGELRKFGLMRRSHLENHRRGIYSGLLLLGKLKEHLLLVQDQMLWVRRMNNIGARAEEIVATELDQNNHKKKDTIKIIKDVIGCNFIKLNKEIGGIDIIIGGPPCKGFSNANRQKNHIISMNNSLVKEYFRAVMEIKPKAFASN